MHRWVVVTLIVTVWSGSWLRAEAPPASGTPAPAPTAPAAPAPAGPAAKALPPDLEAVPDAKLAPLDQLAPGSEDARDRQERAVRALGLPLEVRDRKFGIVFRLVPPGSFTMGRPLSELNGERFQGADDPELEHRVTLTKAFYCGKVEITQAQWRAVMGKNPAFHQMVGDERPVDRVMVWDCRPFADKLCELAGVPRGTYRLPTEAEWEYACRAGTQTALYSGPNVPFNVFRSPKLEAIAWFTGNSCGTPQAGGMKLPNAWGLHDMIGNLYEPCQDWWALYPAAAETNPPPVAQGKGTIYRGGSWRSNAQNCRAAARNWEGRSPEPLEVGCRLVRVLP